MKNYFLKGISIAENRKNKKNKLVSERERIVFSMRVQTSKYYSFANHNKTNKINVFIFNLMSHILVFLGPLSNEPISNDI